MDLVKIDVVCETCFDHESVYSQAFYAYIHVYGMPPAPFLNMILRDSCEWEIYSKIYKRKRKIYKKHLVIIASALLASIGCCILLMLLR